jgi:prolyl 4-hydroxylase|tara:strand:- start:159 stop:755 length:597 start_codon:yes stop_codon:yes gene_type:complete
MKKIDITNNKNPNFIGAYNIENDSLCEKIVSFFEENKDLQSQGAVGDGVDEKIKKSTDITIYPNNLKEEKFFLFKDYLNSLNQCYQDYRETYPFLKKFIKKVDLGYFNIQKYLPGGHFAELHSERTSLQNLHRLFAWMTYLNDVDDGGTTDFDYFDIKVKPEKGKTLIWPAEWTHAHTGSILKSGKKYIITGWMHFGI